MGTAETVNPMINGETSISNIVKRFPINYLFKPLMYLSVILMILYWYSYNLVLNKIFEAKRINVFFIFGFLSAVFLLLHVFFLGKVYDVKIYTQIRRSYIVFFILFELLAQAYLLSFIWKKRRELKNYFFNFILVLKLIFVSFVCISTTLILVILIFYDLSPKIDYALEWNYFLILLIYYLLSFFIWKKLTFTNPAPT